MLSLGFIYSMLLLLSLFSRVRLCMTPWMAARQAPLSLGFSRQEHWSELPFPSPMYEGEKWKWSCSVVSNLATPWTAAYQAPPSMGFSRQEDWSGVPLPSPFTLCRLFISPYNLFFQLLLILIIKVTLDLFSVMQSFKIVRAFLKATYL